MRHISAVFLIFVATLAHAQTYKVGDRVVPIATVSLETGNGDVGPTVFPGLPLTVTNTAGKWLWVRHGAPGWIDKENVVPFDKALDYLTEKVEQEPTNIQWRYGRACLLMNQDELDHAIADFTKLIRRLPSAAIYNSRALAWKEKGEYDKAIQDFDEAIKRAPKIGLFFNNRGRAWEQQGESDKALQDYTVAIRLDPKNTNFSKNRAFLRMVEGEYAKAIQDYSAVMELDPKDTAAVANRGLLFYFNGEYDKAIRDYSDAIWLEPKNAELFRRRGSAWQDKGDFDKAIQDFSKAIQLAPQDATLFHVRGVFWIARREYIKALRDYDEALRLDPKNPIFLHNRGYVWLHKGDYDKAIEQYNEAIKLNPKIAESHNNRGLSWEERGEYAKAIQDYREAMRLDPKYSFPFNNLAWLLATCPEAKYRDGTTAVKLATKSCELSEWKDADSIGTLAAAYAESGDFEKAVKRQHQVIELALKGKEDESPLWKVKTWRVSATGDVANMESERLTLEAERNDIDRSKSLELYKQGKPYRTKPANAPTKSTTTPEATANQPTKPILRVWTSGEKKASAKFVQQRDGWVQLEKEDGQLVSIPLAKLSEADQEYVKNLKTR